MDSFIVSIIFGIIIFTAFIVLDTEEESVDKQIKKRLEKVKNKRFEDSSKAQEKIKKNIKFLFQDTEYKIKILGTILSKVRFTENIKKMLKSADINVAVDVFILMQLIIPAPFIVLALIMPDKAIILLPIAGLLVIIPFVILNARRKQRLDLFTKQFPDSLGLISSSLRAGHSLNASFQTVVNEMPEPINNIFKSVVDDISLGRDTRDAMNAMLINLPDSLDLRFFVTAVLIQREIGGNLAEILDSLSNTIRERFKLIGQLKAQTAMARMSGVILAVAPVVIGGVIYFLNPEYMQPLFTDQMGQMCLAAAVVSAIVGYIIIMKVTNIKV